MTSRLTRLALVRAGLAGAAALAAAPGMALGATLRAPVLRRIRVRTAEGRYAGSRELLATVSPGVPGRDLAVVSFELDRAASVRMEAVSAGLRPRPVIWEQTRRLAAGAQELRWSPPPSTPVGAYVLRLSAEHTVTGARRVYGGRRPATPERAQAPVVQVVGLQATFAQRSYLPEEPMRLTVFADVPRFTLSFVRCGWAAVNSARNDEFSGTPMGEPVPIDWTGKRAGPRTIEIQGGAWPSGLYAVRLEAEDGRLGFAPFVLRSPSPGPGRAAVVLPTNTWQAYNFFDANGDGWGDTWYAGGNPAVLLDRPYLDRGVPPRYRRYDLPFIAWLRRTGRSPDFLADDDLEAFPDGDELRRRYDLVVFPGHSEYVTERAYDNVQRFRDLGGRLVFLSANNFFWKVVKDGDTMRRVELWRKLGRPEASLIGVQYRANDDGTRQGVYYVIDAEAAPWLFPQTGLGNGSALGASVGGYGIEVDGTTPDSPPGTKVLALVPSLFGPGVHGEMTYYETEAGARVFAAGTLDFGASVQTWPVWKMLDNLWRHMLEDAPAPPGPPS